MAKSNSIYENRSEAVVQTFDYPESSQTLLDRWNPLKKAPQSRAPQSRAPQSAKLKSAVRGRPAEVVSGNENFEKRRSRQPIFKKSSKASVGETQLVEKIRAFDSKHAFLINGAGPRNNSQSKQAAYAPDRSDNIESSIFERAGSVPAIAGRQPLPTETLPTEALQISVGQPNRHAPADPVALSTSVPARPRASSFEHEFSKAIRYIESPSESDAQAAAANTSGSVAPELVRVAEAPGNIRSAARTARQDLNRVRGGAELSNLNANGFAALPEVNPLEAQLSMPSLSAPGREIVPEFTPPVFNELAPNEAPADFSPPQSMSFVAPWQNGSQRGIGKSDAGVDDLFAPGTIEKTDVFGRAIGELATPQPDPKSGVAPPAPPEADQPEDISAWVPPAATDQQSSKVRSFAAESETGDAFRQPSPSATSTKDMPVAWWKVLVAQPLHPQNNSIHVNTSGLVLEALSNSPRIKAVSKTPLIRELQVVEADAEFDPVTFLQSQFEDRNDPVGNSLTTGGEPFLRDNIWSAEGGIRRRLRNGGDYQLSQRLGFQNSNSNFFTPQDQGTATLALNVTQPLLRGRGEYVNQAQILIAQSAGGAAWDTFKADLQEELEGMVAAYWNLYLQRSIYLQKKRNVERGQVMLDRLNGRRTLDAIPAQITRAESAVLTRRTELANAFRDVRNAETEIRRRAADRNWQASQSIELVPSEMPFIQPMNLELEQVVFTALENRPEIAAAIRQIRIAGVQRDVSANDLLPDLSLLLGTYVSSLRGDTGIFNAFQDQFGQVKPGYSVGFEFELPYRNRAARSRLQQRNLQFQRLRNELEDVIQNVIAEAQVATRQVESALETLRAADAAVGASRADLIQNETRWESFALLEGDFADGQSPTIVLDQLLDSQERLSQAENVFAQAEQSLKVAEISLQRAMGTLLMHQQVNFSRSINGDAPAIHIEQAQQVINDDSQFWSTPAR